MNSPITVVPNIQIEPKMMEYDDRMPEANKNQVTFTLEWPNEPRQFIVIGDLIFSDAILTVKLTGFINFDPIYNENMILEVQNAFKPRFNPADLSRTSSEIFNKYGKRFRI
jgi:hypothetical protein